MKSLRKALLMSTVLGLAASFLASAETDEKGFIRVVPDQLEWKSPLGVGIHVALISGDPTKPGSVYGG